MTNLKEGDKAPDFSGLNEKGKKVSLKNFKGKKLILFFYPQDNTPTCTIEACNLRDNFKLLKKKGFKLLVGAVYFIDEEHLAFWRTDGFE